MSAVVLTLILGTATPGGGFPLYGEAFAEMVNAQEPLLRVEPRNTKGSTENVPLLEAGQLDIALVAGGGGGGPPPPAPAPPRRAPRGVLFPPPRLLRGRGAP